MFPTCGAYMGQAGGESLSHRAHRGGLPEQFRGLDLSWDPAYPQPTRNSRAEMKLLRSMADTSPEEVGRLLAAANAVRWRGDGRARPEEPGAADAERRLDALFRTGHARAVYGTLAPGRPNHHVVAPLGGEWTEGVIEGDLLPVGWGAALGYPAFRPRAGGDALAVQVLAAPALEAAWPDLDRFEGPEYRRILVPVFTPGLPGERRLLTVANLYAAADAAPADGG